MAYAYLTSVGAQSTDTNNATTAAIDTTGATLLVAAVSDGDYAATGLSDSQSNDWTPLTTYSAASTGQIVLYYCVAPTTNAAHTFTVSSSGASPSVAVASFSGAHATPADQHTGATGSAVTALSTGSITPSENDCLIVSGVLVHDQAAPNLLAINSSMTKIVDKSAAISWAVGLAYKIQTTAAAINPQWSWTDSCGPAATIASFKAAAGAGGPDPFVTVQFRQVP